MKYLLPILTILLFIGCADDGYWMQESRRCIKYELYFQCRKDLTGVDMPVAICKTAEECNKICADLNKEIGK